MDATKVVNMSRKLGIFFKHTWRRKHDFPTRKYELPWRTWTHYMNCWCMERAAQRNYLCVPQKLRVHEFINLFIHSNLRWDKCNATALHTWSLSSSIHIHILIDYFYSFIIRMTRITAFRMLQSLPVRTEVHSLCMYTYMYSIPVRLLEDKNLNPASGRL